MSHANAMKGKIAMGRGQIPTYHDDKFWRDTLEDLVGLRSLSGCTDEKLLARVIDFLASKGAVFTSAAKLGKFKAKASQRRSDFYYIPDGPHATQKRHIAAMWRECGYPREKIDGRVKKQFKVETFLWLNDPDSLQKLGKDLAGRLARKKAKAAKAVA